MGTELIGVIARFDLDSAKISKDLIVTKEWSDKDFSLVRRSTLDHCGNLDLWRCDLEGLRDFLLTLLENPNLLEHESFTNLLRAVFHLTEELLNRRDLKNLADKDREHLSGDIKRVYGLIIAEWLNYMNHLNRDYPYLFSLAMRTNPFDAKASVEIK